MKKTSGIFTIIFLGLMMTSIHLLALKQQQRLQNLSKQSFMAELHNMQPTVKNSANPETMAARKAAEILAVNSQISVNQLPLLHSQLIQAFGQNCKFLVTDYKVATHTVHGFSAAEADNWHTALNFFHNSNLFNSTEEKKIDSFAQQYLDKTFAFGYLPNYLNIFTGTFSDKTGLIVLGNIMNPAMLKVSKNRKSRPSEGANFPANYHGCALAFIPEEIYNNPEWLSKNSNQVITDGSGETFAGNKEQMLNYLQTRHSKPVAQNLSKIFSTTPTGIHLSDNFGYCFTQIKQHSLHREILYFSFSRKLPDLHLSAGSMAMSLATFIAFIFIAILSINNLSGGRFFGLKLNQHFLTLAIAACSIPMLALAFQAMSQYRAQNLQRDTQIFNELETSLSGLEKEYQNEMGEILTLVKVFQESCENLTTYSHDIVEAKAQELDNLELMQVFSSDNAGNIDVVDIGDRGNNRDDATRVLKLLMNFIQQSIKFGTLESELSVKDGVLVESIAEAIGNDNMYMLALQQNRLLTFKMLHGAIWTLSMFQKDPGGLPLRLFLYIFHRSAVQDKLIDRWQQRHNGNTPAFLFANQNFSYMQKMAPIWLERKPELAATLRELNSAGGIVKTKFFTDGQQYYCVGRKLKDFDWACLAIKLQDNAKNHENRPFQLILLAIFSLIVLLLVAGKYFSNIFITPVNSLTESVKSMAAGNYDLRIKAMSNDEIGIMCQSFNSMAVSLKEKEYLSRFLSEIAKDAISGKVSSSATRIEGTVLFSDIRDFTSLTEQRQPEEIVSMLNDYITRMGAVIEDNDGTIEKLIGDAVMAVFLPVHGQKLPAIRAASAAEDMLRELEKMNLERQAAGLFTIKNGVGIATGTLLMGTIGNHQGRREFTVTGRTVLQAAEMEKLTREVTGKKIVLCPHSAELVISSGRKTVKLKTAAAHQLL